MKVALKELAVPGKSALKLSDVSESGKYPVYGASGLVGYRDDYQCESSSVAIIKDGAGVGRVSLLPAFSSVLGTMQLLRPIEGVDVGYLSYAVKSLRLGKSFVGSTIPHIYFKNYGKSLIEKRDIFSQRKISSVLHEVEEGIEMLDSRITMLDSLVKSRFIEMFPDWDLSLQRPEWKPLGEVSDIYTGTTPSTSDSANWEGGTIPWVTPAELSDTDYIVEDTERHITEKGRVSKSLTLMPKGTVLLSTRAPIGKVAITGVQMTCNQGFKNFGCHKELNPTYLYSLLKMNKEWLQSQGTGTTFKEISKSKAEKIRVFVPEKEEQDKFESFYRLLDKPGFDQRIQHRDS